MQRGPQAIVLILLAGVERVAQAAQHELHQVVDVERRQLLGGVGAEGLVDHRAEAGRAGDHDLRQAGGGIDEDLARPLVALDVEGDRALLQLADQAEHHGVVAAAAVEQVGTVAVRPDEDVVAGVAERPVAAERKEVLGAAEHDVGPRPPSMTSMPSRPICRSSRLVPRSTSPNCSV